MELPCLHGIGAKCEGLMDIDAEATNLKFLFHTRLLLKEDDGFIS